MALGTKDISLDKLVYRFESAIFLVKKKITMKEVAKMLDVSPGFLSRYKKPRMYMLNPASYEDVFEVIDQLILVNFNKKWNSHTEEYELATDDAATSMAKHDFNPKLTGLNGSWMSCSWNEEKTTLSSKYAADAPSDYFDVFSLEISGEGNVTGFLEATRMTGEIVLFAINKIMISLASEGRRLTMMGQIPLCDDLAGIDDITVTYIDSGDLITGGVAILSRMDDDQGIRPRSVRKADLEDKSDFEKDYLTGKQVKADPWKFLSK